MSSKTLTCDECRQACASYVRHACKHTLCLRCAHPWLSAGIVACMQCEPGVDLGDDPRTCRISMPVPRPSEPSRTPASSSWTVETDPTHVAFHVAKGVPWAQLLAHGWTPQLMVNSGVSLHRLVEAYGWEGLVSWGFDATHFANMGADPGMFRDIPESCLVDFRYRDVVKACPTVQELLATAWSPAMVRRMGYTWKILKKMGIEEALQGHAQALATWRREFGQVPCQGQGQGQGQVATNPQRRGKSMPIPIPKGQKVPSYGQMPHVSSFRF